MAATGRVLPVAVSDASAHVGHRPAFCRVAVWVPCRPKWLARACSHRKGTYLIAGEEYPGENAAIGAFPCNLRGIVDPTAMDRLETAELARTVDGLINEVDQDHRFFAHDICHMHERWLVAFTTGPAGIDQSTCRKTDSHLRPPVGSNADGAAGWTSAA